MPVLIELGLSPVAAPHFADAEVLDAVLRSTRRRAAIIHAEMSRGLAGLATVASTASFLGVMLTCYEIVNAFRVGGGEKSSVMAALFWYLSEAMIPTGFALGVAIPAFIMYHLFSARLAGIRMEMEAAGLALVNVLSLLLVLRAKQEAYPIE